MYRYVGPVALLPRSRRRRLDEDPPRSLAVDRPSTSDVAARPRGQRDPLMTADPEELQSFGKQHFGALLVGGFALLLAVIVVVQLWEKGDVARWLAEAPGESAYALCFGLVWFDAIIPIFPGETTLSAASTLAAEGDELELRARSTGARSARSVGDSSLFSIARQSAAKVAASWTMRSRTRSFAPHRDGLLNRLPGS